MIIFIHLRLTAFLRHESSPLCLASVCNIQSIPNGRRPYYFSHFSNFYYFTLCHATIDAATLCIIAGILCVAVVGAKLVGLYLLPGSIVLGSLFSLGK